MKNIVLAVFVGAAGTLFFVLFLCPYLLVAEVDDTKTEFKVIEVEDYISGLGNMATVEYYVKKKGLVKQSGVYIEDKSEAGDVYEGEYNPDNYKEVTIGKKAENDGITIPPVIIYAVIFVVGGVVISEFLS